MSKPAALSSSRCRIHAGTACIAFLSLLQWVPSSSLAAVTDPALRHSEQIDLRHLGTLSAEERSVLRLEWRSAITGVDEAHIVQDMLDRLRRVEVTVGEVARLIRGIPAQKDAVASVAAETPERLIDDKVMVLSGSVAAGLLALWWFSSRRKGTHRFAAASPNVLTVTPKITTTRSPEYSPQDKLAPEAITPAVEPLAPVEMQPPAPDPAEPASTQQRADAPAIGFSLEEADPESVARANARLQKQQARQPAHVPVATRETSSTSVEPTLELAEIMLSMGLEQGAAQTLVEYTEANPREALHHWLKLLDIHRNSGQLENFRETAEKLRLNFNIQAEDWARSSAHDVPTLENFSRLAEEIQRLWPRPEECIAYLKNLLEDNRDGTRAGFPRAVAEEILLLIDILKATYALG